MTHLTEPYPLLSCCLLLVWAPDEDLKLLLKERRARATPYNMYEVIEHDYSMNGECSVHFFLISRNTAKI